MHALAVLAAILVGVAFLLAGGAKIAAGQGWAVQARELGAPRVVTPLVPWVEVVTGSLLAAQVARRWTALVAAALLVAFSALIARRLSQGRRPVCACFGTWSARPIGPGSLVRNAILLSFALAAAVG